MLYVHSILYDIYIYIYVCIQIVIIIAIDIIITIRMIMIMMIIMAAAPRRRRPWRPGGPAWFSEWRAAAAYGRFVSSSISSTTSIISIFFIISRISRSCF